jgi:hypothetical protein
MHTPTPTDNVLYPDWPEAIATVLECRYDMRAGRALAFGVPSGKHFRIRYNYFADGALHEGQLYSATAMPQNTLFPVRYNPELPHEHSHEQVAARVAPGSRRALLIVGVIGSVVLSLAWFAVLRGCR